MPRAEFDQHHPDVVVGSSRGILRDREILVPARPATHVTCDACYDDHVEEVTRIKDRKGVVFFRIYCPEAGWVDLPEDRLRQWTVDIAGESYDVVFVRLGGPAHEPPLDELARKHPPARTIVVASRDLPESSNEFAAMLPLATAFLFTEGQAAFQLDRVRSIISAGSIVDGNVFRLRGEFWQLSFDGETKFLKDSVGMGYIALLLMEPNVSIPAVTLLAARAGIDPLVATGSSGEVLDDEAREKYGKRYRALLEDLAEAKEKNDLGLVEKLESEMEALTNQLASATGLGGRSRAQFDIEKVRKSVSMAVSRDIERIAKSHESLRRHLDAAIDSGLAFRYAPERDPDWLT